MADFRGARIGEPLEERIARLEDIESIRQVKHQYAICCDNGYDADRMAPLFVEDAIWESNKFGTHVGRETIRDFIREAGSSLIFALHYMNNAIIDVASDGLSARGTWILYEPATMTRSEESGTDSVIITADYDDQFVKRDGIWQFKHVKANFRTIANLQEGWHEKPFRDD